MQNNEDDLGSTLACHAVIAMLCYGKSKRQRQSDNAEGYRTLISKKELFIQKNTL